MQLICVDRSWKVDEVVVEVSLGRGAPNGKSTRKRAPRGVEGWSSNYHLRRERKGGHDTLAVAAIVNVKIN